MSTPVPSSRYGKAERKSPSCRDVSEQLANGRAQENVQEELRHADLRSRATGSGGILPKTWETMKSAATRQLAIPELLSHLNTYNGLPYSVDLK